MPNYTAEEPNGYVDYAINIPVGVSSTTLALTGNDLTLVDTPTNDAPSAVSAVVAEAVTPVQAHITNMISLSSDANLSLVEDFYAGRTVLITKYISGSSGQVIEKKIKSYDATNRILMLTSDFLPQQLPEQGDLVSILGPVSAADQRSTTNLALIVLDYLTNKRYGAGLKEEQINKASFLQAARTCDTKSDIIATFTGSSGALNIGDSYKYVSTTFKWQGTITKVVNTAKIKEITFSSCIGKLTNMYSNIDARSIGDVIWEPRGSLYQVTTAGLQSSISTNSTVMASFSLVKVGAADTISLPFTNGNPIEYTLYDSDFVKYWKYLGWDSKDQRWATRHQGNILLDTSQPVFSNIGALLDHFNGILTFENGQFALSVETKADSDADLWWNFQNSAEGWIGSNVTILSAEDYITLTPTNLDPIIVKNGISFRGADNLIVRARVRRTAGSTWDGRVFYTTDAHSVFSASYYMDIADSTILNEWVNISWDMSTLTIGGTDWNDSFITGIRLDLGSSLTDVFDIEWLSIGSGLRVIEAEDIIGSVSIKDDGLSKSYNSLSASISDPQKNFASRSVSFFNSDFLSQDRGVVRSTSFKLDGITNYYNARLAVEQILRRSRYARTISLTLRPVALALTPGTLIRVKYPRFGWDIGKYFRIQNLTIMPDCLVEIVAEEHDDSIYFIQPSAKSPYTVDSNLEPEVRLPNSPPGIAATNTSSSNQQVNKVTLSWTGSTGNKDSTFYEVWRGASTSNPNTPIASGAVKIGVVPGTQVDDSVSPPRVTFVDNEVISPSYYYWLRTGNRLLPQTAGVDPKTYFSSFAPGVLGTIDLVDITGSVTSVVTESYSLREELDTNAISALHDVVTQYRDNKAVTEDVASHYLELGASIGDNSASITQESIVRASADSAIALDVTTLTSTVQNPVTGLAAVASDLSDTVTRVESTEEGLVTSAARTDTLFTALDVPQSDNYNGLTTYNTGDGVIYLTVPYVANTAGITGITPGTTIPDPWTKIILTSAAIQENNVARIGFCVDGAGDLTNHKNATLCIAAGYTWSGDTSLAAAVKALRVEQPGGTFASIETATSVIAGDVTGLNASYSVKVDVNGRVSGFGIASSGNTAVPTSEFVVIADKFSIVDPTSTGLVPLVPFQVSAAKIYMGTDVVINGDLITIGTIDAARLSIGSGDVGLDNVENLNAQSQAQTGLTAGTIITGGGITLNAGGNIKGGQTAYNTGTGFFLGYSTGYKFSIGNGLTKGLTWDGTNLRIAGDVLIGGTIASTVTSGAAAGATANQASTATILGGTLTGNVSGTVNSVAAATVTSGAASGATANQDSTGTILGGTLTGNVSGTVNSVAAATVTTGAASGATALTKTAKLDTSGNIASGLSLQATGSISSGQTAYNTGTGFWLERNAGIPRFSIGSAANFITWNGTSLAVKGSITVGTTTLSEANTINSNTTASNVGLGSVQNLSAQGQAQTGLIAGTIITGGGITLNAGGNIKGGQTDYASGTGFFLGYSAGYKFSIGSATKYMRWDGTTLSVSGNIVAGATIASSVLDASIDKYSLVSPGIYVLWISPDGITYNPAITSGGTAIQTQTVTIYGNGIEAIVNWQWTASNVNSSTADTISAGAFSGVSTGWTASSPTGLGTKLAEVLITHTATGIVTTLVANIIVLTISGGGGK